MVGLTSVTIKPPSLLLARNTSRPARRPWPRATGSWTPGGCTSAAGKTPEGDKRAVTEIDGSVTAAMLANVRTGIFGVDLLYRYARGCDTLLRSIKFNRCSV
jgi:hypothetical protein